MREFSMEKILIPL